jgi:hypothetical protein
MQHDEPLPGHLSHPNADSLSRFAKLFRELRMNPAQRLRFQVALEVLRAEQHKTVKDLCAHREISGRRNNRAA